MLRSTGLQRVRQELAAEQQQQGSGDGKYVFQWSPNFLAPGTSFVEDNFSMDRGFRMIQVHYIYCALYFHRYYISSISNHQALDPRSWGPLL